MWGEESIYIPGEDISGKKSFGIPRRRSEDELKKHSSEISPKRKKDLNWAQMTEIKSWDHFVPPCNFDTKRSKDIRELELVAYGKL
jgi:hypothetical protein